MVRAERAGSEVPGEFEAVVVGAHARSLDLRLEHACGDVRILALQESGLPMTPVGVRTSPEGVRLVAECGAVSARGHVWSAGGFRLDTRGVPRFRGRVTAAPPGGRRPLADARTVLARHLHGSGRSLDRQAADTVSERLTGLTAAVAGDDRRRAETAARSLVGLGPGLTPSGDDALCGFMAARLASAPPNGADRAVTALAARAWNATSDVSAQHLALASRGLFGEALLGVAGALTGPPERLDAAAGRCAAVGASSGVDALLGVIAALGTLPA